MRERAVLLRFRPGLWSAVSLPTDSAEALREGGPTNRAGAGRRWGFDGCFDWAVVPGTAVEDMVADLWRLVLHGEQRGHDEGRNIRHRCDFNNKDASGSHFMSVRALGHRSCSTRLASRPNDLPLPFLGHARTPHQDLDMTTVIDLTLQQPRYFVYQPQISDARHWFCVQRSAMDMTIFGVLIYQDLAIACKSPELYTGKSTIFLSSLTFPFLLQLHFRGQSKCFCHCVWRC